MKQTRPEKVIKFCPRCGSRQFSYREDNSFMCGVCRFQLYVNSAAAVAALIVDDDGRLLITRRGIEPAKGMLDLPGGFVDVFETAEEAIKREIKEELNLNIKEYSYLFSSPNEYVFKGLSVFTLDLAYLCKVDSFNSIKAGDDVTEFLFMYPDEIKDQEISSPSIKRIIHYYRDSIIMLTMNK